MGKRAPTRSASEALDSILSPIQHVSLYICQAGLNIYLIYFTDLCRRAGSMLWLNQE